MNRKMALISLLSFLALMMGLRTAYAATITTAVLDKNTYVAGDTGYILVTVYNDESEKIRVTQLSATVNYYYADGVAYVQKFFTGDTLPDEILAGQSEVYQIPISLPNNIAHGYINPVVEAQTEIWQPQGGDWHYSDRPTYPIKLYIESSYKQDYETSQAQLEEQKATNTSLNNTMNILAVSTVVLASAAGILMFFMFARKNRAIPVAQA